MIASAKQVITGLYVAFYNRAPDKAGLAYWEQRAGGGNEVDVFAEIAAGFAVHPKFSELYGHLDNQQFVEAIYHNVLGHAGDNQGIKHWTAQITGEAPRSDMVVDFIYSALNFDASDEKWNTLTAAEKDSAQNRHDTLVNKTAAAIAFVDTYGDATNITPPADLDNDPAYLASIVALSNIDETPTFIGVAAARLSLPGGHIVIDAGAEPDTSVVVFDLIGGTSSDHSDRTFLADTAYTVYIRVDSTTARLSSDANSGAGTWGVWAGGEALGADDVIILVGSGAPIVTDTGARLTDVIDRVSGITTPHSIEHAWRGSGGQVAGWLTGGGSIVRTVEGTMASVRAWSGQWPTNPAAGHTLHQIYAVGIPAGVLTSQGLA